MNRLSAKHEPKKGSYLKIVIGFVAFTLAFLAVWYLSDTSEPPNSASGAEINNKTESEALKILRKEIQKEKDRTSEMYNSKRYQKIDPVHLHHFFFLESEVELEFQNMICAYKDTIYKGWDTSSQTYLRNPWKSCMLSRQTMAMKLSQRRKAWEQLSGVEFEPLDEHEFSDRFGVGWDGYAWSVFLERFFKSIETRFPEGFEELLLSMGEIKPGYVKIPSKMMERPEVQSIQKSINKVKHNITHDDGKIFWIIEQSLRQILNINLIKRSKDGSNDNRVQTLYKKIHVFHEWIVKPLGKTLFEEIAKMSTSNKDRETFLLSYGNPCQIRKKIDAYEAPDGGIQLDDSVLSDFDF